MPPRGLVIGWIRVVAPRLGSTAKGQPEFPRNLRPEFAEHVETYVLQNAVAYPLRCWSESSLIVWVICVAQYDRAGRSQPFGKIEHSASIVAVSHDRVLQRVKQAPPRGAVG